MWLMQDKNRTVVPVLTAPNGVSFSERVENGRLGIHARTAKISQQFGPIS